jgi:hypothetical protein
MYFVNNNQISSNLNLDNYCNGKVIEVCAIQLNILSKKFYILKIYRSLSGNFSNFMIHLEQIQHLIYNPSIDFIMCGDINCLEESGNVKQLNGLLKTYKQSPFQPE